MLDWLKFLAIFCLFVPGTARAATYNYVDNASSGSTAIGSGTSCASPLIRTINVSDSYAVGDVKIGFIIQHAWRGDVQITVTSPSSTSAIVVASAGGDDNLNWNIELDDTSSNPLDNNFDHSTVASPHQYTVGPSNPLSAFDGENVNGNWTFSYCDTFTGADDGNLLRAELIVEDTVTGGSGGASNPATGTVINSYAKVNSISGTTLGVSTTTGFTAGGRALVVQMQGSSVTTSDNATHGDITAYNSAGRFEYVDIVTASGGAITITSPLTVTFNTSGSVQIVSVPVFNGTTVAGTIVPLPWDGNTGGVVALDDIGTLTMAGDIDATGLGFRGGAQANTTPYDSCASDQTNYTGGVQNGTGNKGEGIIANSTTHAARRGHRANGGGGGNITDAAGGGGGNVGAGGLGGRELDLCDNTGNFGGLGGQALDYSPNNRLFMGGGGGSGSEVSQAATGGDRSGGGLIFVRASDIAGSGGRFISDGLHAAADNNNGSDGGSAAGAIAISVRGSITGSPITEVAGGDGGDEANGSFAHGTGGGGGGGAIRLFGATCSAVTPIVDGGEAGTSVLGAAVGDPNWGALDGGPGNCLGNFSEIGVVPLPSLDDLGDAPISYGAPSHTIVAGVRLGTVDPDADSVANPTVNADGDDTTGTNDENSISFVPFVQGGTATISTQVAGSGGFLQAWIDWNGNGNFSDIGEQVLVNGQDNGTGGDVTSGDGIITFDVTVPVSATTSQTYARFRWSTDNGLGFDGTASDGEVEDYVLTITASPGAAFCPANSTLTASTGNADTVIVAATNSAAALGTLSISGTTAASANSAQTSSSTPTLTIDLTETVPENSPITLSVAKNNAAGAADIEFSADNSSWNTVVSYNAGVEDRLHRTSLAATSGGVRYIRFSRTSGSLHIDGVEYTEACLRNPDLVVSKTSLVYSGSTYQFAVPGSDALYSISVTNSGAGVPDNDSVFIYDELPDQVSFYNDDVDGAGPETDPISFTQTAAGLTFTYATDVAYSDGTSAPSSMADCNYSPSAGYDSNVNFICINPKGIMASGDPDPQFTVQFRARID
jgi:subtilisin-like proprotein convertase family protein